MDLMCFNSTDTDHLTKGFLRGSMQSCACIKEIFVNGQTALQLKNLKTIKWMNNRAPPKEQYQPTYIEHVANIVTHGIWIFPSSLGLMELIRRSQTRSQLVSALVYGLTLVSLFSVSTGFHCVFYSSGYRCVKDILHRCDRAMIYIFIAGSYFPWLMMEKLPMDGWSFHFKWIVWVMAFMGIIYQQLFHEKYKSLEIVFYLVMGVGPSLAIISEHYITGLIEVSIGGLLYVLGIVFFKCDGFIPFAHAIWHLFVSMAAYFHYYAILNYLYPSVINNISEYNLDN